MVSDVADVELLEAPGRHGRRSRPPRQRRPRPLHGVAPPAATAGPGTSGHDRAPVPLGEPGPGSSPVSGARDLSGLQARGAHLDPLRRAAHNGAHRLDVRVPATLGPPVGVRDAVAETGALAADVAVGSHSRTPVPMGAGQQRPE